MKILNLAWRNVLRHKRRTIITASAISVGLAAMIYMDTMMNGVDKLASKNIIDFETGNLEIFAKGYYREEGLFPLDTIIENPETIITELKTVRGINGVAPRIKFQSRINNGIEELSVLGIGIDRERDASVFALAKAVVKGSYIKNNSDILIGTDLALDMDLDVGSSVTVITKDRNGTYNASDFIVAGLVNTGHPLFDKNGAIIPLEGAQRLLTIPGSVTELCIKIGNEHRLGELKKEISGKIGNNYEVYTYKELNAAIFEISSLKRTFQFLLAVVVVIIAAVGIINTMLMAVMERIPEIGTMKAFGFNNSSITKMFLYEGTIIGLLGSLWGCVLGLALSFHLSYFGLDFYSRFKNMNFAYPIKFIIKGDINYLTVLYVFIFGVIVSCLVTLGPVRKATKLESVEALRHV